MPLLLCSAFDSRCAAWSCCPFFCQLDLLSLLLVHFSYFWAVGRQTKLPRCRWQLKKHLKRWFTSRLRQAARPKTSKRRYATQLRAACPVPHAHWSLRRTNLAHWQIDFADCRRRRRRLNASMTRQQNGGGAKIGAGATHQLAALLRILKPFA